MIHHDVPSPEVPPDPTTTMHRGCGTFGLSLVALLLLVAMGQTVRFAQSQGAAPPASLILASSLVEQVVHLHLRRSKAIPGKDLPREVSQFMTPFPQLGFLPQLPAGWPGPRTLIEASFHPSLGQGGLQLRYGIAGERPLSLFLLKPPTGLQSLPSMTFDRGGLRVTLTPGKKQLTLLVEIP
jgi:hypothetical protein